MKLLFQRILCLLIPARHCWFEFDDTNKLICTRCKQQ